jgi:Ca2+-binding RTX toxin-like protein
VTGTVTPVFDPYQPPLAPRFPAGGEGDSLKPAEINGVDPRLLTGDGRDVSVIFNTELARFHDSLGFYTIGQNGQLQDIRIVFPNINTTEKSAEYPLIQDGKGPLAPGTEVSLGHIASGTEFGFFLVQDGFRENPESVFQGGTYELRNSDGEKASLTDSGGLTLYHVVNGVATEVKGLIFVTSDATPDTPDSNPLNVDGHGHAVSGWDSTNGGIAIGFEDQPFNGTIDPKVSDRDFNDTIFTVKYGDGPGDFVTAQTGQLDVHITNGDSSQLASGLVEITKGAIGGDLLSVVASADANHDGRIDGTSISYDQVNDTKITFSGLDTAQHYADALNAVQYTNDTNPPTGTRELTLGVTDANGIKSDPATLTLDLNQLLIAGDENPNLLNGTNNGDYMAGRGGDDTMFGNGGDDTMSGGNGLDILVGGDGNDQLDGGGGVDTLTGGQGSDTFVARSISYSHEIITDFNANQGDKLDLSQMLDASGFDPQHDNLSQWVELRAFDVDGDGKKNDIQVRFDPDGPGKASAPQSVADLIHPVGVSAGSDPHSIVATNSAHSGSDGATS